MSQFVLYLGLGLAAGVLYTGVGLGVVTTFKAAGIVNLAQVGFGMWGAFTFAAPRARTAAWCCPSPARPPRRSAHPRRPLTALVIALAMTALLGAVSYLVVFRPLRNASTVATLVASTGLLAIIQSVIVLQFGTAVDPGREVPPGRHVPRPRGGHPDRPPHRRGDHGGRGARAGELVPLDPHRPRAACRVGEPPPRRARPVVTRATGPHRVDARSDDQRGAHHPRRPAVNLSPIAFGLLIVPGLAAALIGRLSSVMATCAGGLLLGVVQAEVGNLSTKSWWPEWARVGIAQLVPFLAVAVVLVVLGSTLPFRGDPIGARLPSVRPARPRPVLVLAATACWRHWPWCSTTGTLPLRAHHQLRPRDPLAVRRRADRVHRPALARPGRGRRGRRLRAGQARLRHPLPAQRAARRRHRCASPAW